MADRVNVIAPNGDTVSVPLDQLDEALKIGFRAGPAALRLKATSEQPVQAGIEGALRGATLGLSDRIAQGLGADPADLKAREKANPIAEGVGEFAGIAGSSLIPGSPAARIAKAGAVVKGALAARPVLAVAAQGATEMGLYGLGQAVVAPDGALDAEKLGAMTAVGAGTNLALHGAAKGAGMAGSKLLKAFGGDALKTSMEDTADKMWLGQLMRKSDRKGAAGKYAADLVDYGKSVPGMRDFGSTAEKIHDLAEGKVAEHGAKISDVLAAADESVSKLGDQAGFNSDMVEARIRNEVLKPIEKSPTLAPVRDQIEKWLKNLDGSKLSFRQAWDEQTALREKVGFGQDLHGSKEQFDKIRKLLRDEVINQAGEISPYHSRILSDESRGYAQASTLKELAAKRIAEQESRPMGPGLFEGLGFLSGGPMGLVKGAALHVAKNAAADRMGFMGAAALDKLGESSILGRIGKTFQEQVLERVAQAPESLGPYRLALENAAAQGTSALLATHIQLASTDPNYLPTVGMKPETPQQAQTLVHKADQLEHVHTAIAKFDLETERSIKRFLSDSAPTHEEQPSIMGVLDFKERVAALAHTVGNPASGGFNNPHLVSVAPNLAIMSKQVQDAAADFLLKKAPKNPYEHLPEAFKQPWEPAESELEKWYRFVETVNNPHSVLDSLKSGQVSGEQVEALREVYPKVLEEIQAKMMEKLAMHKGELDYQQKGALKALFGNAFTPGEADNYKLIQGIHKASIGGSKPGPSPTGDGRQKVNQEANLQTQAQRLEGRGQ